jgi:hypothetical protein
MTSSCKFFLLSMLALFVAGGTTAAHDSNELQSSVGAVCDSRAQAERLIRLAGEKDNPREALNQVNDEAGQQDACVVAPVYYLPGNKVSRISTAHGTYEVVEILVVGVDTVRGTAMLSNPVTWFAVFQADDQDV